jgi:3'-phosphoadenosine 5'-phosphosulfate sulfotransferase
VPGFPQQISAFGSQRDGSSDNNILKARDKQTNMTTLIFLLCVGGKKKKRETSSTIIEHADSSFLLPTLEKNGK